MRAALVLALLIAAGAAHAQTLAYDDVPLRDAITDIEHRTDWRFLYSDALVAGKRLRLRASAATLPELLGHALAEQGVGVEADPRRRRILLVPAPRRAPDESAAVPVVPVARIVSGRVVDGRTGEALPYATVTWGHGRRGVVADESGAFTLARPGDEALTASFVGYRPQTAAPTGDAVTFRLQPDEASQPDAVVSTIAFVAPVDTAWAARLQPGRFDVVGEGGGLSALEVLPSIAPAAVFSEGPIVRGSPSDAFEVRLDGAQVYNPQHLFGLVDAFNADALRAVALYLGVAPPRVPIAPGGAIDYATSTGSPRRASVQAGVSTLAARAVASVPLRPGRTTLLVGGRRSLLGAPWGQDAALVEHGLGAVQSTSPLPTGTSEALARVVQVLDTQADFWDLHLGASDERADGGRTTLTAYAGGDDTRLDAVRLSIEARTLTREAVATQNRWGSRVASVTDQRPLSARVRLTSRLAGSGYSARFGQDDFAFRSTARFTLVTDTLGYRNDLREAVAEQRLDAVAGAGVATGGYRFHLYRQSYDESAANRPAYSSDQRETRLDLHAGWAGRAAPALDVDAGLRAHLYSAGTYVRLSPRLRARLGLAPGLAVSVSAGRSTQFLHRLTLGDVAGAAAWVLTGADQTVTEATLGEVSVEIGRSGPTAQLTAYGKRTRGQWFHAEDLAVRSRDDAVLERPWISGVEGRAVGAEALIRLPVRPWSLGASAALARITLQHPDLNGSAAFAAAWDRLARLTLLADGPLMLGVRASAAWTVATGAPNPLAGQDGEDARLGALSRLDVRATASRRLGGARASVSLAVRNALDQDNAFTRQLTTLVRSAAGEPRLRVAPVDVYDLGILPTVDISVSW